MKKTYLLSIVCVFLSAVAFGQTPAPVSTPDQPKEIMLFTGVDWNRSANPQIGGGVGALYPVTPTTAVGVVADFTLKKSGNPFTSVRVEAVRQVLKINSLPIYAIADCGTAFSASDPVATIQQIGQEVTAVAANIGTNLGYAAATGLGTDLNVGKGWHVLPSARVVKGSLNDAVWVFGVKFARKVQVTKGQ